MADGEVCGQSKDSTITAQQFVPAMMDPILGLYATSLMPGVMFSSTPPGLQQ
jgi:hypothetical protein